MVRVAINRTQTKSEGFSIRGLRAQLQLQTEEPLELSPSDWRVLIDENEVGGKAVAGFLPGLPRAFSLETDCNCYMKRIKDQ